jgi:hypothetical protein
LGQPAVKRLCADGSVSTFAADFPLMYIVDYQNGHNLPAGTVEFVDQRYGPSRLEILGLPISDPYWMDLVVGGQRAWVLWQGFERGTVTFNPLNHPDWQYEGGLTGNLFIAALNRGLETILGSADAHLQTTHLTDSATCLSNGVEYSIQTRVGWDAPYCLRIEDTARDDLANLVARDGELNQFKAADLIVLRSTDQLPEGLIMAWAALNLSHDEAVGSPKWIRIGCFGSRRLDHHLILYYVPEPGLPADDVKVLRGVGDAIARFFFRMTISGGECTSGGLEDDPDHMEAIWRGPFYLSPYSPGAAANMVLMR